MVTGMIPAEQIRRWISERKAIRERATARVSARERGEGILREFELTDSGGVLFRSTSYGRMEEDAIAFADSRNQSERWENIVLELLGALEKVYPACSAYIACEDEWKSQRSSDRLIDLVLSSQESISRAAEMLKERGE